MNRVIATASQRIIINPHDRTNLGQTLCLALSRSAPSPLPTPQPSSCSYDMLRRQADFACETRGGQQREMPHCMRLWRCPPLRKTGTKLRRREATPNVTECGSRQGSGASTTLNNGYRHSGRNLPDGPAANALTLHRGRIVGKRFPAGGGKILRGRERVIFGQVTPKASP